METWAYCEDCHRWFYVAGSGDENRPDHACPACETVSVRVVRSGPGGAQVRAGGRA